MDRMKQQPIDALEARKEVRRRRRRRRQMGRIGLLIGILLLLVLVGAFVVLRIIGRQAAERGETTTFLAVNAIEVEGDTRYTAEELIEKSGLYVGQSLLAVNKVQAHDALLAACPYLEQVEVGNASFDTLRLRVKETNVVGAVQVTDGWMILGENNHALEHLTEEQLPAGTLRIVGATLAGETVGDTLLDERSLRICRTLVDAAQQYGLKTITTIDMTEKTDLSLLLNERLEVLLGNETNLTVQVEALVATLPTLIKNNGENVSGRLDMTSYADDDSGNDRSIYTPKDLLEEMEAAAGTTTPEGTDGETTGTDAGTTGTTRASE